METIKRKDKSHLLFLNGKRIQHRKSKDMLKVVLILTVGICSITIPINTQAQSRIEVRQDSTEEIGHFSVETPTIKQLPDSTLPVSLDFYEYWVADTSESATFRLHVRNSSDSLVVIDHVEPSCGCIMTTVQRSFARKEKDAEIYIGLMTSRMNDFQPYTVDVYTTANLQKPLRLYIRKKKLEQTDQSE